MMVRIFKTKINIITGPKKTPDKEWEGYKLRTEYKQNKIIDTKIVAQARE